jgi:hypothetical protein
MDKYSIEIPNTRTGTQRTITLLLLLMNILVFAYIAFGAETQKNTTLCIIGASVNGVALLALLGVQRFPFLKAVHPGIAFIISAIIWAVFGKFLLTILMLLFGAMAIHNSGKLFIRFSAEGIRYPSFPEKTFPWENVSQVILKDDVLTIDLKNNQLLQFNLAPEVAAGIDAQKFDRSIKEWSNK